MKRLILLTIIAISLMEYKVHADWSIQSNGSFVVTSNGSFSINQNFPAPTIASGIIDLAESGVITISSGASSGTATLANTYDMTRSSIFYSGTDQDTITNTASSTRASLYVTNSNTLTAKRGKATTDTLKVAYHIVEWSTGVTKSVQRGETFLQNGIASANTTITSVVTGNSFINNLGQNSTSTAVIFPSFMTADSILNSTTVKSNRGASTDGATSTWQITEFNNGYINSSQQCSIQMGVGLLTNTCTLGTSVNTNSTILFYGGATTTTNTYQSGFGMISALTNSTTVTATRFGTNAIASVGLSVVDFNSTYLNSNVQTITTPLNGVASNTSGVTSVNTSKSLASWLGSENNNNGSTNTNRALTYCQLTNGTTMTCTKGLATGASTSTTMILESK